MDMSKLVKLTSFVTVKYIQYDKYLSVEQLIGIDKMLHFTFILS